MLSAPGNFRETHSYFIKDSVKIYVINQKDHQYLLNRGYESNILREKIVRGGVVYSHIEYSRAVKVSRRVEDCVSGIFMTLICGCCFILGCTRETCRDGCYDYLIVPATGVHKFQAYLKLDKESKTLAAQDSQKIGFDFTNRKEIIKWIKENRHRILKVPTCNHQYIPIQSDSGRCGIVFIPNSVIDDSTFIRFDKLREDTPYNTHELNKKAYEFAMTYRPGRSSHAILKHEKVSENTSLLRVEKYPDY